MRVALRASGGRLDDSIVPLLKPCVGARQPRVVCTREHVGQFMLVSVRPRASELLGSDLRPMCGLSTSAVEAAQSTPVARLSLQRMSVDCEQPAASLAAREAPAETAPAPRSSAPATPTPAAENAALVQVRATLEALQEVQRDFAAEAQALTAARAAREEGEAKLQSRVEAAGAAEARAAGERRALQEALARLEHDREGLRTEQLQWAQAQQEREQQRAQAAAEVARRPTPRVLAHAAAQTDPVTPPPPIVRYVPRPAPATQARPRRSSPAATQFALGACLALLLFAFFSSSARASRCGATSSTRTPHVLVPAPMATTATVVLRPLRSGASYLAALAQAQGRVAAASVWTWLHTLLQSGARQRRADMGLLDGQPPAKRAIAHKAKPAAPAMRQLAAPRDVLPARASRAGPAPVPSPQATAAASPLYWRLRRNVTALLLLSLLAAMARAARKSTRRSRRRLRSRLLTFCGWCQPGAAAGTVHHNHHAAPAGPTSSTRSLGGGRDDGLGIERTPNSPWHSRRGHHSPHHYDFDD